MLFTNAPPAGFLSSVVSESGVSQMMADQWWRWVMIPQGNTYEIQRRETGWPPVESGACGACADGSPCESGWKELDPAQKRALAKKIREREESEADAEPVECRIPWGTLAIAAAAYFVAFKR
jgi:hypothetical protein